MFILRRRKGLFYVLYFVVCTYLHNILYLFCYQTIRNIVLLCFSVLMYFFFGITLFSITTRTYQRLAELVLLCVCPIRYVLLSCYLQHGLFCVRYIFISKNFYKIKVVFSVVILRDEVMVLCKSLAPDKSGDRIIHSAFRNKVVGRYLFNLNRFIVVFYF